MINLNLLYTPSPVHIDQEVHEGEEEESHAASRHDEADGPEVLVDGDDAVVEREAREGARQETSDEGPEEPARHSALPVLVDQQDLPGRHAQPAEDYAVESAQQPLGVIR